MSAPTTAFAQTEAQPAARAFSRSSDLVRMMNDTLLATDLVVVLTMSGVAYLFQYGVVDISLDVALATLLAAVLLGYALKLTGCYGRLLTASITTQIVWALQGWCLVFIPLFLLADLTATSDQFSWVWTVTWFSCTALGLVTIRLWRAHQLQRWHREGKLARTVAVVDLDGRGSVLARDLLSASAGRMQLLGVFPDHRVKELLTLAHLFRVDEVIIAAKNSIGPDLEAVVRKLGVIPGNIHIGLPQAAMAMPPRNASFLFGQPTLTLRSRPLGDWAKVTKRTEDLVIGIMGLVLVLPLLMVVAILIKLDSPGPVLFRQRRVGFNNNVITVFKLRTMTHRSEARDDVSQAKRIDPRVTRVGRFLRRTSMDELPQLMNVIRGDMSLVGPRPHALAHNEQYAPLIDGYLDRHRVQPGITGWAQVNGFRGETDTLNKMQRRVEHDLVYMNNWSLAFDLKIIAMTVLATFTARNAY